MNDGATRAQAKTALAGTWVATLSHAGETQPVALSFEASEDGAFLVKLSSPAASTAGSTRSYSSLGDRVLRQRRNDNVFERLPGNAQGTAFGGPQVVGKLDDRGHGQTPLRKEARG